LPALGGIVHVIVHALESARDPGYYVDRGVNAKAGTVHSGQSPWGAQHDRKSRDKDEPSDDAYHPQRGGPALAQTVSCELVGDDHEDGRGDEPAGPEPAEPGLCEDLASGAPS